MCISVMLCSLILIQIYSDLFYFPFNLANGQYNKLNEHKKSIWFNIPNSSQWQGIQTLDGLIQTDEVKKFHKAILPTECIVEVGVSNHIHSITGLLGLDLCLDQHIHFSENTQKATWTDINWIVLALSSLGIRSEQLMELNKKVSIGSNQSESDFKGLSELSHPFHLQ